MSLWERMTWIVAVVLLGAVLGWVAHLQGQHSALAAEHEALANEQAQLRTAHHQLASELYALQGQAYEIRRRYAWLQDALSVGVQP